MSYEKAKGILFQVGIAGRKTRVLNWLPLHTPSKPSLLLLLLYHIIIFHYHPHSLLRSSLAGSQKKKDLVSLTKHFLFTVLRKILTVVRMSCKNITKLCITRCTAQERLSIIKLSSNSCGIILDVDSANCTIYAVFRCHFLSVFF